MLKSENQYINTSSHQQVYLLHRNSKKNGVKILDSSISYEYLLCPIPKKDQVLFGF